MLPKPGREIPHAESGFALIEVLISGLIAVVAATGVLALMQSSIHQAGEQRNRTQAYALAQEDQARMRTMRIPALKSYEGEQKPVIDGVQYVVKSKSNFVNDVSGLLSCGNGTSSADYITISSEVTWPNMSPTPPTVIKSIISPPSGSLNPKAGTLTIRAEKAVVGTYLNALELSGTGPSPFTGSTEANGCAVFPEQLEGTYQMEISGGTNLVDKNGVGLPFTKTVTVNPETTTPVTLYYDTAGKISPITFKTAPYSGSTAIVQKNEQAVVFNSEMQSAKTVGTVGSRVSSLEATSLFPFTTTYSVYGGGCTANNPMLNAPTNSAAVTNVTVPAGGSIAAAVTLPALLLTVKKNNTATNGITVKFKDNNATCPAATWTQPTVTMSSTAGRLAEPGLPYGNYTVCASTLVATGNTRKITETFDIKAATTVKEWNITTSSPETGACP
jgi:Tfp pilus assembly protein PilV